MDNLDQKIPANFQRVLHTRGGYNPVGPPFAMVDTSIADLPLVDDHVKIDAQDAQDDLIVRAKQIVYGRDEFGRCRPTGVTILVEPCGR